MKVEAVQRYLRQIALPEVGPDGQERLSDALVALAGPRLRRPGGDPIVEVAARYLAAAGVGKLRLIGAGADGDRDRDDTLRSDDPAGAGAFAPSLAQSNPDVRIESIAWPSDGAAWLAALDGADLVLRAGFDDDAMLRAAVRLGLPAVVARGLDDRAELISFRRQGPCPHAALDVPIQADPATGAIGGAAGAAAVVAGTLAAAEALHALLRTGGGAARARHLAVPLSGGEPRAQEIPWSPECFSCGGSAMEMSFS
jgi:molybdopterin/thiamine biosynthesis adenylyltransferase